MRSAMQRNFTDFISPGGPCDNAVSISTSWSGGYTATLVIPIKTSITSWKIDLTLSAAITNLEVRKRPSL